MEGPPPALKILHNVFQQESQNILITPPPNSDKSVIALATRTNREFKGAAQNLPLFMNHMKTNPNFKMFDMRSMDVYDVNIGVIEPELELDLFNAIKVDANIPFVVLNRDRKKDLTKKGRWMSEDRNFKICHSADTHYPHDKLISVWKDDAKDLNIPETLIMKVFLPDENDRKVKDQSYVDVIYRFDEGVSIHLQPSQTKAHADRVIKILQSNISGFPVTLGAVYVLSGSFVLDFVFFDRYVVSWMLMNPFTFPSAEVTTPFHFWPFLWINEKNSSLTARSHLKLKFKFGNITSKIVISTTDAKPRDIFYQNGIPVRFSQGQTYNSISIKKVKSVEHAIFIKDMITLVSYLYQINRSAMGAQNEISMYVPAAIHSRIIDVVEPTGQSFEIVASSISRNSKDGKESRNFVNKQIDPTFYGSIPTTKYISSSKRPAQIKVSTRDPDWQNTLARLMAEHPDVQVIRYPLQIIGSPEFQQIPKTVVPPYFLFADTNIKDPSIYLKPRSNPEPIGSEGTYHPYLFTCINRIHLELPGGTNPQARFNALVDLTTPYVVRYVKSGKSGESNHVKKTMKILRHGENGFIPGPLEIVLGRFMLGGRYRDGAGIERQIETIPEFQRMGTRISTASILHVLVSHSKRHSDLRMQYFNLSDADKEIFIQTTIRQKIVAETNWNIARQELYDWELRDMQTAFLDPKTFVDTKLYKTVLEKFFGVYLLVIAYDRESSVVEIPRHKFCYFHPLIAPDSQAFVFFKHSGAKSFTSPNPQYEVINIVVKEPNGTSTERDWDILKLNTLFGLQNRSIDVHFSTVLLKKEKIYQTGTIVDIEADRRSNILQIFPKANLEYQFIDGAGKLRAFVHTFKSSPNPKVTRITVSCEPLAPIDLDCFDDLQALRSRNETMHPDQFLAPQEFDIAIDFIKSLGISVDSIDYHMEFQSLVAVEDAATIQAPDIKKIEQKKDSDAAAAKEKARLQGMSLQERLAAAAAMPTATLKQESALLSQPKLLGKPQMEETTQETLMQKIPARKVVKMTNANPKAIGVWFKIPGHSIRFYIATTPGTPLTKEYSVNNEPYFSVVPENVYFRQHDEFERIANVLIQLARNLYIYSRWDDVDRFMQALTTVDPTVVYDVRNVRRQIPSDRIYSNAPTSPHIRYPAMFPTFFSPVEGQTYFKLTLDSALTQKRVRQHLKMVQTLKENIIGASGSKIQERLDESGIRIVQYTPYIGDIWKVPRIGIDDEMIEGIPRLSSFYNRPMYIIEFYAYASDFARRGPDQNILMSTGEMTEYLNLLSMENRIPVVIHPLPLLVREHKFPVHYASPDGSLYIIQNVEGASLSRVNNVIVTWVRERVNLGYYTPDFRGEPIRIREIKADSLNSLDPALQFSVLDYGNGQYAALLKLESSISDTLAPLDTR